MKRIADPENLKSENPAIKAAAKIKTAEDSAEQKIKAIKYLATVGCDCYPGVREALIASLSDCTEEVRYEAAIAFCEAAGNPCQNCGGSCCNAEVMSKLHEMAYGADDKGCPKEASPRVRSAAANALNACRRKLPVTEGGREEPGVELPVETPYGPVPGVPPVEKPAGGSAGEPQASVEGRSLIEQMSAEFGMPAPGGSPPGGFETAVGAMAMATDAGPRDPQYVDVAMPADGGEGRAFPSDGVIRRVGGLFGLVAYQEGPAPLPPEQPMQPELPPPPPTQPELFAAVTPTAAMFRPEGEIGAVAERQEKGIPAAGATASQANVLAPEGLGSLLAQSSTVPNTKVQRRSPVSQAPNVRGYKEGQVYADANGAFWMPARQDLDTMLSKFDPGIIRDVVVIPGPYGLRYGPGFAFIDVQTEPTPRNPCGFQSSFDTSGNTRTNGGQFYGRETAVGGGPNWGCRFSYGQRKGSDYRAGNGLHIPSSYNNRDIWGELSYDINPCQRVDFRYLRLDQTDTEYPAEFFDLDYLGTYGFDVRVVDEDPAAPWTQLSLGGWYNRTHFRGSNANKNNPNFPVMQRVEWALDSYFYDQGLLPAPPTNPNNPASQLAATTDGGLSSSGARAAVTFGEPDQMQFRTGADFRYLEQKIEEHYLLTVPTDPVFTQEFYTDMPHAWLRDPGVYAEWSAPVLPWWTLALGARLDWVATRARASEVGQVSEVRRGTSLPGGAKYLDQNDTLYAFYVTNDVAVADGWSFRAGFGYAQRPPTMIERYADGLFLSIIQSGFSRVIGDPRLKPARNWQVDAGLRADHDRWRGRADFFHAWVIDYVTLGDGRVEEFFDARLVEYLNTPLATLVGFEAAGEFDLLPRLSAFGLMSYVEGRDQIIDAYLPSIPPLDSTVGLRLHDLDQGRRWGIELGTRIVDQQEKIGRIRSYGEVVPIETPTPGFTVWNLRAYWNRTENLSFVCGIDNLFDRSYEEHLDLRLLGPTGFPVGETKVLSPGFTPYVGVDWVF